MRGTNVKFEKSPYELIAQRTRWSIRAAMLLRNGGGDGRKEGRKDEGAARNVARTRETEQKGGDED